MKPIDVTREALRILGPIMVAAASTGILSPNYVERRAYENIKANGGRIALPLDKLPADKP